MTSRKKTKIKHCIRKTNLSRREISLLPTLHVFYFSCRFITTRRKLCLYTTLSLSLFSSIFQHFEVLTSCYFGIVHPQIATVVVVRPWFYAYLMKAMIHYVNCVGEISDDVDRQFFPQDSLLKRSKNLVADQ